MNLLEFLLAKVMFMYYPIRKLFEISRCFAALFVISIFSLSFQSITYAENILLQEADSYRAKGYEEQQKGNLDKALGYYSKALSIGLENEVVYNDVGVIYEQLGFPERAEESYLKAIDLKEDYLPPYTNLAYLYKNRGEDTRAISYFQERLKRAPANDPWHQRIKDELNDLNPGFKFQAIQTELNQVDVKLTQEAQEKAKQEFQQQVIRVEKHFQKAQEYIQQKNYDEALEELDRAQTLSPHNPKLMRSREQVVFEQQVEDVRRRAKVAMEKLDEGDLESARKAFQEILATIPDSSIQ